MNHVHDLLLSAYCKTWKSDFFFCVFVFLAKHLPVSKTDSVDHETYTIIVPVYNFSVHKIKQTYKQAKQTNINNGGSFESGW